MSRISIKDVYDIVLRVEDKLDNKISNLITENNLSHSKIHERVNNIENDISNIKGQASILGIIFGAITSFVINLFKKYL